MKNCFFIFEHSLNLLKLDQMKRKFIALLPLLTLLFNTGCKMKEPVDNLIIHAKIYSVDSRNRVFEAMAVRNGKIVALGTDAGLSEKYQPEKITDARGKIIFPGFIDAHCHFYGLAQSLQYVDLTGAVSFDEVLTRIREAGTYSSGSWIVGRGWDQNLWKDKIFPDKKKHLF